MAFSPLNLYDTPETNFQGSPVNPWIAQIDPVCAFAATRCSVPSFWLDLEALMNQATKG